MSLPTDKQGHKNKHENKPHIWWMVTCFNIAIEYQTESQSSFYTKSGGRYVLRFLSSCVYGYLVFLSGEILKQYIETYAAYRVIGRLSIEEWSAVTSDEQKGNKWMLVCQALSPAELSILSGQRAIQSGIYWIIIW